mmetsp:Transcript_23536/g.22568  ORF Transcript_23536/g.22568 Transcript_23536/m.22568 type:complete len:138 (-) Transcript_23536:243-656(-)
MATIDNQKSQSCPVCDKESSKRCSRCKAIWYCSAECQRSDWKTHKKVCNDTFQADQYTLHKMEFDRIRKKYGLDQNSKADKVAEFLTSSSSVTPPAFAEKFGTSMEEAVVFLEWIKVGIKFKEESIDVAKNSGLGKK